MSESPEEMLDRVRRLADYHGRLAQWEIESEAINYVLEQAALYRKFTKQRKEESARIAEIKAELDRKSAEQNQAYTTRIVEMSNSYCRAAAEAAVLLKFLNSECQWLDFHADMNNDSMSYDNFRKLRAFLGEESHAQKMLDRIAELEADRERLKSALINISAYDEIENSRDLRTRISKDALDAINRRIKNEGSKQA